MMSIFALLPVLATLLLAPNILAQDKTVDNYPQWVTNDYNCVIKCLEVFNDQVTARPSPETELQSTQCIVNGCNKDTMAMNIYQSHYIIQMFYATGSIFEDPNMGNWGNGTPPDQQPPPPQDSKPAENPQSGAPDASSSASSEASAPNNPGPMSAASSGGASSTLSGVTSSSGAPQPSSPAGEPVPESAAGKAATPTGWLAMAIAAGVLGLSSSFFS